MTLVKVCGITSFEDAMDAVEAGADMLGFNFFPRSPRYISPESARGIIDRLPNGLKTIGVFVNESTPDRVIEIASQAGVSGVQLHGDETPDYCRSVASEFVIKALAVGSDFVPEAALQYEVDAILLDAKDDQLRGGTGKVADWRLATQTQSLGKKIVLAGGLSTANVVEAIQRVRPYAVDACSALEVRPGKKDKERVREFVAVVHAVKP